jgi:hypothetical protein
MKKQLCEKWLSYVRETPTAIRLPLALLLLVWAKQVYLTIKLTAIMLTAIMQHDIIFDSMRAKGGALLLLTVSATLAFGFFLIWSIYRRRAFARVFVLVAFLFWTLLQLWFSAPNTNDRFDWMYIIFGVATALLFTPKNSAWYKKQL